uniref:Uncharacterized protein n=1 Tax=Ditylum brightwellii TaxID=49249 RepID=A0A7S4UUY9_9STRA|mmetsp:Transcript_12863/g.17220  ORF Transcript_12863/g.17220 Transcript_12863/m.17220 type:complete len:379 (+) Transcript_12863:151-1287(+)
MGERSQQQQEQKQQEQPRKEEEDDIHITSINFASALSFAEEEGGGYWNQEKEEEDKSKKKTKISEEIAVFSAGTVRALLLSLKKQSINIAIRRRAFRSIGERTTTPRAPCATKKTLPIWIRTSAILGLISKNIMYGLTVFGVYDFITAKYHSTHYNQNPFSLHFTAGAFAGLAQSSLLYLSELFHDHMLLKRLALAREKNDKQQKQRQPRAYLHNKTYLFRRMVHHSLGYATLFGVYNFFQIHLEEYHHSFLLTLQRDGKDQNEMKRAKNDSGGDQHWIYYPNTSSLFCCFIAGGIAGQTHYALSHYTEHWKTRAMEPQIKSTKVGPKNQMSLKTIWKHVPKRPSVYSIAASFVPTSVTFVAFEFGGTFVTSNIMGME